MRCRRAAVDTEGAVVIGSLSESIKLAVAQWANKHGGVMPAVVYVPRGRLPEQAELDAWAMRGVSVLEGAGRCGPASTFSRDAKPATPGQLFGAYAAGRIVD